MVPQHLRHPEHSRAAIRGVAERADAGRPCGLRPGASLPEPQHGARSHVHTQGEPVPRRVGRCLARQRGPPHGVGLLQVPVGGVRHPVWRLRRRLLVGPEDDRAFHFRGRTLRARRHRTAHHLAPTHGLLRHRRYSPREPRLLRQPVRHRAAAQTRPFRAIAPHPRSAGVCLRRARQRRGGDPLRPLRREPGEPAYGSRGRRPPRAHHRRHERPPRGGPAPCRRRERLDHILISRVRATSPARCGGAQDAKDTSPQRPLQPRQRPPNG
mmetsp:Transcript_17111/g.59025  ORF Transcript_17111/g.59025 Transcript_17111/m.59025 type:complete len:268 (-) Transcript_17111:77-880(-)